MPKVEVNAVQIHLMRLHTFPVAPLQASSRPSKECSVRRPRQPTPR